MQPSDRALRDVLRREAAQVRPPEDMWNHISRRLAEPQSAPEQTPWLLHFWQQGRSVLALAAAAAVFWVMPTPWHLEGQHMDRPRPLPAVALTPTAQPEIATKDMTAEEVMLLKIPRQPNRQSSQQPTGRQNHAEQDRQSSPSQVNTPR